MDNALLVKILRQNNRLVIPGFGAFLVKETPQGSSCVFSPFLKRDDGVLKEELMREFSIEPQDAQDMIKAYIAHVEDSIKTNGRYFISGVGALRADSNGALSLQAEMAGSDRSVDPLMGKESELKLPDMDFSADISNTSATAVHSAALVGGDAVQEPATLQTPVAMQGTAISQPYSSSQSRVNEVVSHPQASVPHTPIAAPNTPDRPVAAVQGVRPVGGGGVSSEARRSVPPAPIHGVSPTPVSRPIPSALTPGGGANPMRPVVTPRPAVGGATSGQHGVRGGAGMGANANAGTNTGTGAGAPQRGANAARPIASSPGGSATGDVQRRGPGAMPGRRPAPGARPPQGKASSKTDVWLVAAIIAACVVLALMAYGFFVSNPTIEVEPMLEADTTAIVITE